MREKRFTEQGVFTRPFHACPILEFQKTIWYSICVKITGVEKMKILSC
jgi:hypothetical protein